MKISFNQLLGALAVVVLFGACYPDQYRGYNDYDVVLTNYDETADFSSYVTFHLPDTIIDVYDSTDRKIDPLTPAQQRDILEEIRKNFLEFGWVEIDTLDSNNVADVVITTSTIRSKVSVYYQLWWPSWGYWGGWGYYPGYGGCCYYPGYPYYPTYGGTYKEDYSVGSVQIDMIDPFAKLTDEEEVPVVWTANVFGLLSSNTTSNQTRYAENIALAFDQSPYIKK